MAASLKPDGKNQQSSTGDQFVWSPYLIFACPHGSLAGVVFCIAWVEMADWVVGWGTQYRPESVGSRNSTKHLQRWGSAQPVVAVPLHMCHANLVIMKNGKS